MSLTNHDISSSAIPLAWAIGTLSRFQGVEIDRLRLHDAIGSYQIDIENLSAGGNPPTQGQWQSLVRSVALKAGIDAIDLLDEPDQARLPALTFISGLGWCIIHSLSANNEWILDVQGVRRLISADVKLACVRVSTLKKAREHYTERAAYRLFRDSFNDQRKVFFEAGIAGIIVNIIAIFVSMYSMQIYDRVIPTQGYSTLFALTLGVCIALMFDLIIKLSRSYLMEEAIKSMDSHLAREIFTRFLNLRLDQLPSTVGSLAGQLRGFETIRAFLSAKTMYLFVDAPFGILFILMMAAIGNPAVALVPFFFLIFSIAFGFAMQGKIDAHAIMGSNAGNQKTGLLVEAIEGAETIKAGGGSWKMLSKWIDTSDEAMRHDLALRTITEKSSYITNLLQQASYIGLIAVGAYFTAEGQMTMGALIACSILSGRALSPVAQIPGLIVQAALAKAALNHLEGIFVLEQDNHGMDRPIMPEKVAGHYFLERVRFAYKGMPKALIIPSLRINSGEKIGVIGPVGAGKSTLLRLLTGMYRANEGRILLDGLDIHQLSRQFLGERIGYLQQDHRLFSGTLRENLLIGIADPGDEAIRAVAEQTGLIALISSHPNGLDLPISEGGKGLSGGQRQLLAFTRLILTRPDVWLLDEPTASMDVASERKCMTILGRMIKPGDTVVLVTHKHHLLQVVERVICIANHEIVLDGSRDEVIKRLAGAVDAK